MRKVLIWLLAIDALVVFVLQVNRINPWLIICLYWLILTIKNLIDVKRGA